jgi:hypothetical protein
MGEEQGARSEELGMGTLESITNSRHFEPIKRPVRLQSGACWCQFRWCVVRLVGIAA